MSLDRPSSSLGPRQFLLWARAEMQRRLHAGDDCRAEEFFALHPRLAADADDAVELVVGEFLVRRSLGQRPDPATYYARFPQWREQLEHQLTGLSTRSEGTVADDATRSRPGTAPAGGDLSLGRHEIFEEIGRGGMGVVYRARDTALGRQVALKRIRSGALSGPDVERFGREARAAALLRHPHIIPVYAVGLLDGEPCYTMLLAEGGSLARHAARYRDDPRGAAALLEKVARAVHAAHGAGVIHRDLKPGNILLDEHGEPLVADFGLAKLADADAAHESTRTGHMVGTPAYMAPEQVFGQAHRVTAASDVWALGVILYELLTGRRPFIGQGFALEQKIVGADPPAPRAVRPGLPADLERIVLRCLEKAPSRRYPTAEALADDLRRWREGAGVATPAPPWWRRAAHFVGLAAPRPALASMAVLAALLLLLGGFLRPVATVADIPQTSDEAERQRVLDDIRRHLAAGKTVVLVDGEHVPRWYQWRTETGRPPISTLRRGPLNLETGGVCLLDLLPDVPCRSYRFSAQVLLQYTRMGGYVGLYVGGSDRATPDGPENYFLSLSFTEKGPNAGKPRLDAARYRDYNAAGRDRIISQHLLGMKPFPGEDLKAWHELAVVVTPDAIRATWDGKPVKTLTDAEKRGKVRWWWTEEHAPGPPPAFEPAGALGLFVQGGNAYFRRVTIEPLSAK